MCRKLVLLALLPLLLGAADAQKFRLDLPRARHFTMTRNTVVLDDDEKGVPHRFAGSGTSDGTIAQGPDGSYTVTLKPTAYAVKVDGYAAADRFVEIVKSSTIILTLDVHGTAQSVAGIDDLQRFAANDLVSREILGRDVRSSILSAWNDRLALVGSPADAGSTWEVKLKDGTARTWSVSAVVDGCGGRPCVAVQSRWEADSGQLIGQSNSAATRKSATAIKDARLSVQTDVVVDPFTLLPYHETLRQSSYVKGSVGGQRLERRTTRTIESDYVWGD